MVEQVMFPSRDISFFSEASLGEDPCPRMGFFYVRVLSEVLSCIYAAEVGTFFRVFLVIVSM